jgi:hypothetical protein
VLYYVLPQSFDETVGLTTLAKLSGYNVETLVSIYLLCQQLQKNAPLPLGMFFIAACIDHFLDLLYTQLGGEAVMFWAVRIGS